MDYESRIEPILGHLAWLAERIEDSTNDGRAYDAAVLTYNAAAMLQWYFVAPVSYADTIRDDRTRAAAAELIDRLVQASEKIVAKAERGVGDQDAALRNKLAAKIRKVLRTLPALFHLAGPTPARMPRLEKSPNARELFDELLAAHAEQYTDAILKGRIAAAKKEAGPDAALNEAIAGLIYIHDDAREADMSPGLRQPLTRMAAGFFKTAVKQQPEERLLAAQRKRLLRLADALVESAASANQ